MRGHSPLYVAFIVVFCVRAEAAQIGDVNGDGRVSFGDSYLLRRWIDTGLESFRPAPGSEEFGEFIRCTSEKDLPELVYLESLRRASPSPLPHAFEAWPESDIVEGELPEPDSAVQIELDPVVLHTGMDADLELTVRLTTAVPLDALGLILRAEGLVLRSRDPGIAWRVGLGDVTGGGDVRTLGATQYYVVSGGLVAFRTDISAGEAPAGIEAGELQLTLPLNVPRGTPPGTYTVELLAGTEVVTRFGEVLRPELSSSTIEIRESIASGHNLPFPPLVFDMAERRIEGKTQVRISEAQGVPGEEVEVRIQVRTEHPVNYLTFVLAFDHKALFLNEATPVYRDPQFEAVIPEDYITTIINHPPFDTGGQLNFKYAPRWGSQGNPGFFDSRNHSYSYLNPLGEWIDIVNLRFTILPAAGGGVSPLTVVNRPGAVRAYDEFLPYRNRIEAGANLTRCKDIRSFWHYEPTEYIDGAVTISGAPELPDEEPPLDPVDAGIRFFIGDVVDEENEAPPRVEARRGDLVVLPLYMTTEIGLHELRMVFGFDPSQLEMVGFEVNFRDFDGVPFTPFLAPEPDRSSFVTNLECHFNPDRGHNDCVVGLFPFFAFLHADPPDVLPDGVWFADVTTVYRWVYRKGGGVIAWSPGEVHWIGNAHLRVREDATARSTEVQGREIEWLPVGAAKPKRSQSAGHGFFAERRDERIPIPAVSVRKAVVVILDPLSTDVTFLRGDIVEDGSLNLTDPVGLLNSLFGSGEALTCADAADVNDDGTLNLTDAVFLLQHLFSDGSEPPPPPFPEPGLDPTEDALGCERGG